MERIRGLLRPRAQLYERVPDETHPGHHRDGDADSNSGKVKKAVKFEYAVFVMLGVAMLWSWNMFMACATYFQRRFATNKFVLDNFQSFVLVVSCVGNFSSVVYLSSPARQVNANYPGRIAAALKINAVTFILLQLSTIIWRSAGPWIYLCFTLMMVFFSSWASGMMQNGAFSWVNGFDPINTQGLMVGQGVAGVLPAIAQILSVLLVGSVEPRDLVDTEELPPVSPMSAFFYFSTATAVSCAALLAIFALKRRQDTQVSTPGDIVNTAEEEIHHTESEDGSVPFDVLFRKLGFYAISIFLTFAVTMVFPVYTQAIVSVRPPEHQSRFFQPDIFIPWSFMIWNSGDLIGRVLCAYPSFRVSNPVKLLSFSVCRLVFIPLYMMCNIRGEGSLYNSDVTYWLIQITFGASNGWLGANNLMAAPNAVAESEKHATGGFMTMWLVGGLTAGSVLSFFVVF